MLLVLLDCEEKYISLICRVIRDRQGRANLKAMMKYPAMQRRLFALLKNLTFCENSRDSPSEPK